MIYLASTSPRRRALLDQIGVDYTLLDVEIDETPRPGEAAEAYVCRLALDKARAGRALAGESAWHKPVLGADTAVVCDGQIFGKPVDVDDAYRMLVVLSGRAHKVLSAVALAGNVEHYALQISTVYFRSLTPEEIRSYITSGEPFGKAGAYAVQGQAAAFIKHLEGSYSGVMGLPLFETAHLLKTAGVIGDKPAQSWATLLPHRERLRGWLKLHTGLRRAGLALTRDILAGIGLLFVLALGFFYIQGKIATRDFEPGFIEVAGKFAGQVLRKGSVGALTLTLPVKNTLNAEQVRTAIEQRAAQLNIKTQAHQLVPVAADAGVKYMEIFEFYESGLDGAVVSSHPDYLLHLPCRIALYKDEAGRLWLLTLNLDWLIYGNKHLPPNIKQNLLNIQDGLLKIMAAGAGGGA